MTEGMGPAPDARTAEAWRAFGTRLRQWRRRAGLTQAQVGARVGYDHTAISKLEHGTRRTPLPLARRLDELMTAGGALLAACEAAEAEGAGRTGENGVGTLPAPAPARQGPLPGEPAGGTLLAMLPPDTVLPSRLPSYGLMCPVHGRDGCTVPVLADVIALHSAFCSLGPADASHPALDIDTVHALTALLAVCLRADEERAWPGATAVVERTLHAMLRWMALPAAPHQRQLAPLAAEYAQSMRLPATAVGPQRDGDGLARPLAGLGPAGRSCRNGGGRAQRHEHPGPAGGRRPVGPRLRGRDPPGRRRPVLGGRDE